MRVIDGTTPMATEMTTMMADEPISGDDQDVDQQGWK